MANVTQNSIEMPADRHHRALAPPSTNTTTSQLSPIIPSDEELIRDYIPHFANFANRNRRQNSRTQRKHQSTNNLPSELIESDGRISERIFEDEDKAVKEMAYQEIQENRGISTSKAYLPKQIEFLRFCALQYAHKPRSGRFIVTGDKVLTFIWKQVK